LDERELADLEAAIREIIASVGLQWILNDVDTAISEGVLQEKPVITRHQRRQTSAGYEKIDFFGPPEKEENRSHSTVSTNIPYNRRQRVELLLTALKRAVSELPAIQEETVKTLNQVEGSDQAHAAPSVQAVRFLPEDDAVNPIQPPLLSDLHTPSSIEHRASVVRILSELAEELG
jgi:hypothetical protein